MSIKKSLIFKFIESIEKYKMKILYEKLKSRNLPFSVMKRKILWYFKNYEVHARGEKNYYKIFKTVEVYKKNIIKWVNVLISQSTKNRFSIERKIKIKKDVIFWAMIRRIFIWK